MRIGINGLYLSSNYKGGVNTFALGLIDGFAKVGGAHEFVIFNGPSNRGLFEKYEEYPNFRLLEIEQSSYLLLRRCYYHLPWQIRDRLPLERLNRFFNAPYAEIMTRQADVHFVPYCPPQLFPFPENPSVYSIHDIQHVHYPEFFTPEQHLQRKITFEQCIKRATLIQASSNYMRRDFTKYFTTLDEGKVVVIREGVDIEAFRRRRATADVMQRYQLPNSFLFFPAQLWHHKNHITILRALKRLQERNIKIPLVLTGARYEASQGIFDFIDQNSLGSQVFYLGLVPFEDLVSLYQASRFLIMASLHESSSLPILEAAAAGTGIIASRTPSIEEMAEQLEMRLFSPTDDGELADLLAAVWWDDALVRSQIEANRTKVLQFSWDNSARRYIDVFESLGGAAGPGPAP